MKMGFFCFHIIIGLHIGWTWWDIGFYIYFFFACSPNLPWNKSNCIVHRHTSLHSYFFLIFKRLFNIRKSFVLANSLLGLFPIHSVNLHRLPPPPLNPWENDRLTNEWLTTFKALIFDNGDSGFMNWLLTLFLIMC